MKKVAVILAGCGSKDGSEIHESVVTLLTLKRNNAQYSCFAPDKDQYHVIDHKTEETVENENRNMLIESARIARGEIKDLKEYKPDDFDALIFPGGFGVAKNLFTYAIDGVNCKIDPLVEKTIFIRDRLRAFCCSSITFIVHIQHLNSMPKIVFQ